jgi:hypothetical protein
LRPCATQMRRERARAALALPLVGAVARAMELTVAFHDEIKGAPLRGSRYAGGGGGGPHHEVACCLICVASIHCCFTMQYHLKVEF